MLFQKKKRNHGAMSREELLSLAITRIRVEFISELTLLASS